MATEKYVNIGGVWKAVSSEYVNIGGAWKNATTNYANIGGAWKAVPVGDKYIWACEQGSDRLYGIDDSHNDLAGWPIYGADFTDPTDVACDSDGNSYWGCASAGGKGVHKIALDGSVTWSDTGHIATVTAICVDADGNVYWGDAWGRVTMLNSAGGVEWTQSPYGSGVYQVNALTIDYSAGQLYASYGTAGAGRVYRFQIALGNGATIYTRAANILSIAIDESSILYIGDENGIILKISNAGYDGYWPGGRDKLGEIYTVRVGHGGYGYYVNGSQGNVGKFELATGSDVWQDSPAGTSRGLAVDAFGNVYSSHGAYGSTNAVIRKNNSSGVEQWTWQPYVNSTWRGVAVSPGIKSAGF